MYMKTVHVYNINEVSLFPSRTPCKPVLSLEGPVDFGHVVANSKVIAREILLHNTGSKAGDFKIKYAGDKPVSIVPSSGSVPAKSFLPIKV